jgi:hypothetical protein
MAFRKWSSVGWVAVAATCWTAVGCFGEGKVQYPKAVTAERRPSSAEVPVHVVYSRTEYRFDAKGNWAEVFSQEYRILNRAGVDGWGLTGTGWSPWYMARPVIDASVNDPELGVRKLDPKTIAESSAYPNLPEVYSDQRILRAPLPGIRVGSVVTETITRKTTRPFFGDSASFEIPFQSSIPRDKVEVVVDLPEGLAFHHEILDAKLKKSETAAGGRRRIVFSGGPYPAIERVDAHAPPSLPAWPSLAFSTGSSWQALARAYSEVMEKKLEGSELDELARRSVVESDAPLDKANKLLDVVRKHVRYSSIAFGESAIVPAKPAETFHRAYGDCKDQALLLTGMLRAVGMPATLALLRSGSGQDVRPGLPALDVFNHAIVVVPGPQPIWIDPTATYSRAAELPEADQGRLALIVRPDTTELRSTPVATSKENTYVEVRDVRLSELGPAVIQETSRATGNLEQRIRASLSDSRDAVTKSLTEYVKTTYDAEKLASSKFPDADVLAKPYEIVLTAEGAKVGHTDLLSASSSIDYKVLFSFLPDALFEERPRTVDLVLPVAYQAELRYRISPPKSFLARKLPAVKDLLLGPVTLARTYTTGADGGVEARFVLRADKRTLTPADVEAFRKAYRDFGNERHEFVEFEHEGQRLIEARQSVKGLALFQRLARTEPRSATALMRFGLNLSDLGFGTAAREQARAAVALAPDSAVMQRSLGIVLERDAFGRQVRKGYERDGARAAYRRAAELDPTDVYSKVQGALLLEYDAEGVRYRDAASLERAVAEYDAIPTAELAEYAEGEYRANALYALLYLGKFDEVRKRIADSKESETPAPAAIAAAAGSASPVAAVAEADRLNLRGEARSQAFAESAGVLYALSRYADAAALLDAAAGDSSQAATYSNRARLVAGVKRVDPRGMAENGVESFVRKADLLVVSAETREEATLDAMLNARAPKDTLNGHWTKSNKLENETVLPRRVIADVWHSMTKASVEGSDAVGYRVRLTRSGPGVQTTTTDYFVVRESGRYGIRSSGGRDELGCEALHLLDERKDKAARKWLEWAKDGVRSGSGDDPLRTLPFVRLWADGKGSLPLAAAALCATGSKHKQALERLTAERTAPGADTVAVDQAIVAAAFEAGENQKALEAAERLARSHPSSKVVRDSKLRALWELRRFQDYEKLVRAELEKEKTPSSERAQLLRWLGGLQTENGRLKEARKTYQLAIDERQATSDIYNSMAWTGLFLDKPPADLLNHALQAAQLSSFKSYSQLHTLACVYAELGKVEEARQTLAQLLELETDAERAGPGTQYVIGRLAEAYAMPELARSAYEKVTPPKKLGPTATYLLAKARLGALERKAPANAKK